MARSYKYEIVFTNSTPPHLAPVEKNLLRFTHPVYEEGWM